MKRLCVVLVMLCVSRAFALTPIGSPVADIKQDQINVGFDYSHSEIDVQLQGYGISSKADVKSNAFFTTIGYGILDNWEGFFRLGEFDVKANDFDSDKDFAWGFGTKATLGQYKGMDWGTLFQMNWFKTDGNFSLGGYSGSSEIDAYEIHIAGGPCYKMKDMSIYGGPFLHFINGDWSIKSGGSTYTFDVEQESIFGGYVGLQKDITQNTSINIEYQFTGDAQAIGAGIVLKF